MIIQQPEFQARLLAAVPRAPAHRSVTGPGRSGAIAAACWSHAAGVPFIPYGQPCPEHLQPVLVVDTAAKSGATLRKASRRYGGAQTLALWQEPPRVRFWYEAVDNRLFVA